MKVLAIDPGNLESGAVLIGDGYRPLWHGKLENERLLRTIRKNADRFDEIVVEMIASYGMSVGASVFDTCVMIGRIEQVAQDLGKRTKRIKRLAVKNHICHSSRANDANVRQALVDRFAPNTRNYGKGTKKEPGFFYGFKADVWQAYALGVTYIDTKTE